MAGPSGAGMVQAYLRMSRGAGGSKRREYLTALRRESAKFGRDPDLAEFDCLFYCMTCGHLSEPSVGDPMRSEAPAGPKMCQMCGASGLIDLRQTPMVHSLSELESTDKSPSRFAWAAKLFGVVALAAGFVGMIGVLGGGLFGDVVDQLEAGFFVLPLGVLGLVLVGRAASSLFDPVARRRTLPRRWRMARTAKRHNAGLSGRAHGHAEAMTELLRAPLSGRPCIAYEVAVRDDANPASSFSSWRLVEQDNVDFRVGGLDIARGEALLNVERELVRDGIIGSADDATRRFMRTRGLLDSEDVYVYESILPAGATCAASRSQADAPVLVRA